MLRSHTFTLQFLRENAHCPQLFKGEGQCWQLLTKMPGWPGTVPSCPQHLPRDGKPGTSWLRKAQLSPNTPVSKDVHLSAGKPVSPGKTEELQLQLLQSILEVSNCCQQQGFSGSSAMSSTLWSNQQFFIFLAVDLRHDGRRKVKASRILTPLLCIGSQSGTPHPK